jgi:hypothetical protein
VGMGDQAGGRGRPPGARDVYIKVGGLNYLTPAQGKQIVEELHGKL